MTLSFKYPNPPGILKVLEEGLPYSVLVRFQKSSGISWAVIGRILRLPRRTLARRKHNGRLAGPESERLIRLASVYEKAVRLFEGDELGAQKWLQTRNQALGQVSPLALLESEIGAGAVEDLIGRLEYGVYS